MTKKKVLISYRLLDEGLEELREKCDVTMPESGSFSKEELTALLPQYDALLSNFSLTVDKDIINAGGDRLKIISNYAVGFNNIDIDYAQQKGIAVCNTPDPVIEPTAELAYALMGSAARRLAEDDRKIRIPDGLKWGTFENLGVGMYGKTLGIIGMGRIGQAIARRAIAGGMRIVYYNRHRLHYKIEQDYNAEYVSFDELLSTSDFIALSTPLTDETRHLIDAKALAKMKPSAILVNTARGAVIDEQALVEALQNHTIRGAALDVFENEPVVTEALYHLDNVVLSPHCGTATIDARIEMARFAANNILNFFSGKGRVCRVV
ncbi:MAG: NAD(P)-binding domain-containing protein [Paludibacteraceae bacterium]|nr:NAD(P)-binding domain-containing protein [Paludibacteraceae bacterium]